MKPNPRYIYIYRFFPLESEAQDLRGLVWMKGLLAEGGGLKAVMRISHRAISCRLHVPFFPNRETPEQDLSKPRYSTHPRIRRTPLLFRGSTLST